MFINMRLISECCSCVMTAALPHGEWRHCCDLIQAVSHHHFPLQRLKRLTVAAVNQPVSLLATRPSSA